MSVAMSANIDASCAICGAPAYPECPHEGQRLQIALDQALSRWEGLKQIRDWVLVRARNSVIANFHDLKTARWDQLQTYLQTLPCYTLYHRYDGHPPHMPLSQLQLLHSQIQQANQLFKVGIDEDWRRSCLKYPEALDYYFSLVEIDFPDERDLRLFESPVSGARRRVAARRGSTSASNREHRKRERRRSRGRISPAPVPGAFR